MQGRGVRTNCFTRRFEATASSTVEKNTTTNLAFLQRLSQANPPYICYLESLAAAIALYLLFSRSTYSISSLNCRAVVGSLIPYRFCIR